MSRPTAIAALAYPVLTVAAFAAFPEPPGGDVSPAHDPAWLAAHTSAVIAQGYVRVAAALGFLTLAVAVSRRLTGTAGRLAATGGAATGLLLMLAQAPILAAALGIRNHLDAGAVRLTDTLNGVLLDLSSVPAILLFTAVAYAGLRGAAPRSLGWLSAVGVPLAAIDAMSYEGGPFAAVALIGLAYFLIWSLIVGGWLVRTADAAPAISPTPVPTSW